MKGLMTVNEILKETNISRATLYRLIDEGLPYEIVGTRKKLFDVDVVNGFIAKRKSDVAAQLSPGDELTNTELSAMFKCSTQGGMRRSNSSIALVLTSHHEDPNNAYVDYWIGDTLYYTGMGMEGDQDLEFAQNKTLYNSNTNGVVVYLFEIFSNGKYRYRGIVKLVGEPFQEEEEDFSGEMRLVWKFPLKIVSEKDILPESFINNEQEIIKRAVKRMSTKELISKAKKSKGLPKSRNTSSLNYERNPYVREYSLRRANGICELCKNPAPFEVDGTPYLESHHIVWLSEGGMDSVDNTAGVCPNCHMRLHKLNSVEDIEKLKQSVALDESAMK